MISLGSFRKLGFRIVGGFIIIISVVQPLDVFAAATYDPDFFSKNDINLYNPTDVGCSTSTNIAPAGLSGSDNEQKIYNFWIGSGLSPAQASGITGSIQAESGFSPFRQETTQTWDGGGYGIAQFTGGQRVAVTGILKANLKDVFTQYYVDIYGRGVTQANGFVPVGIPIPINDSFLLNELTYLSTYASSFAPSTIHQRTDGLTKDYGITIQKDQKLLDFIKTLTSAGDVAKAWTYLYEYPGDIKATAAARAANANTVLAKYSAQSDGSSCTTGGVISCPGSTSTSISKGDGSIAAIISTAKCITIQPPAGSNSSRTLGYKACSDGGCTKGPPTPANYAAARRQFKTAGPRGTNDAFDTYGADCGNFVSTVMRMSGADPNYPISGVINMYNYMSAHPEKYKKITTTSSTKDMVGGDIVTEVGNGHIILYTGGGQIAQASQAQQMPVQEPAWGMSGVVWRMIK
ncbi:MAG: exported protein of unknown function [Candidatus Saccharibacteria bacterium]|nr:exported protein of unknown function [Candidatus Saccharibacteria bacterium]